LYYVLLITSIVLFPEYFAAFHSFLQSEFSEENIEFWLACEDFRSTSSADNLRWRAEEIYREFIQPTACREVSLSNTSDGGMNA